jgi:hypothetical protein
MATKAHPSRARTWALVLAASAAALAWPARADTDPLKSQACAQALHRLDAARRDQVAPVEPLRQAASRACLGAAAPDSPPSRGLQPPAGVAPLNVPLPPSPSPAVRPEAGEARGPLRIDRPTAVTHCDAGGCWDAQGTRLQRSGDQLIGPRGACQPHASGFVCP